MNSTFLSRFTPSLMTSEMLEKTFVQRHAEAERIINSIRDSALTDAKHYVLLIGPRGIGKTHFIALIYHRVRAIEDLQNRLLIAWLREEEWGVTSFLDLLLRIFRALQVEYKDEVLAQRVELLYNMPPSKAERAGAALLKDYVGDRTLLILLENLDDIFNGLGVQGQKRLRAYLQQNSFSTLLATAQSLFNGVSLQSSPFYGFFRIKHLDELDIEGATRFLISIARSEHDTVLADFIQTPVGRARVRAVHHLAGGNHRVYVIFSQFITRESLDELVEPLMRLMDDLTPYYQSRMTWLSSQQRKIVEFLLNNRRPSPVKEIARRCFITHQTASSQLKTLRGMGYVRSTSVGRESFYELQEPLMRLCVEVKMHRTKPIRLLVDFLRLWYSKAELNQRLEFLKPETLEYQYVLYALDNDGEDFSDPRLAACLKDCESYEKDGDFSRALQAAEELVAIRGDKSDWYQLAHYFLHLKRWPDALRATDKVIELDPKDKGVWAQRGWALGALGHLNESLKCYERVIVFDKDDARAYYNRAYTLSLLGRDEEALEDYRKALTLGPDFVPALRNCSVLLHKLRRDEEALELSNKLVELRPKDARCWYERGLILEALGKNSEAMESDLRALELDPEDRHVLVNIAVGKGRLGHYEEALEFLNKAIESKSNRTQICWHVWYNRGITLANLGRKDDALESFRKGIELSPSEDAAWSILYSSIVSLDGLKDSLASFDSAVKHHSENASAWFYRAYALITHGQYEEALESVNRSITLKSNDPAPLVLMSWILCKLGRHDQALLVCEEAIKLGYNLAPIFFTRIEAMFGIGNWKDGVEALDEALEQFNKQTSQLGDSTSFILLYLFKETKEESIWGARIKELVTLYGKHQLLSLLGQGLVRNIPALLTPDISYQDAQLWLVVWQGITRNQDEFLLPLRILDASIRYKETRDQKVLLDLAKEERDILEPLIGIDVTSNELVKD